MTTEERIAKGAVVPPRFLPAADVLAGETADVYFERARRILAAEGMDPVVTMEIFAREEAVLCGAEEALAYLRDRGVDATGVDEQAWGRFVTFEDPDGNKWSLQQLPPRPTAG